MIITHSSFTRWAVSPETEHSVLAARVAELRTERVELAAADDSASRTLTKNLERSIARYEAKLDALSAQIAIHQDEHGFPFDQSGVDYVYVDEAQEYKNGELRSSARNLRGVPVGDGSQRAMDLDTKLRYLREAHPERQVTMATGTPVSNTVAELYIAMRYLRPDLLYEYGVSSFDAFRAVFCDTTSDMELDVGRSFRRVERLSRYKNLPELARLWGEFADLVRVEDLDLPRPELRTGRRQVIGVEPPAALEHFITDTVRERIEQIRSRFVEPHEDNMLKLSSDARLASFDWQTFSGEEVDDEHSTVGVASRTIAELYHAHKDDVFQSAIGETHPRRGAFQLVFCDLGTPKPDDTTTAYERLRDKLVALGVPNRQIQFIHEHDQNDEEKARFFAACRDGRVAVAIGSTPKLGTGVNVQDRQVALHHLDAPWRPSDVEQRDGRIVRQGNQNPVVDIFVYPTLRSFATYSWQTLERKAGFVGQLMRAEPDGPRSLEVTDEEALSYGEVKAISTGDPDFIELARLEDAVARLERLQRSHSREQVSLDRRIERLEYRLAHATRLADALEPVAPSVAAALANEHPWQLRIGEHTYDNRGDAARALAPLLSSMPRPLAAFPTHGIDVEWRVTRYGERELGAVGLPEVAVKVDDRSHDGLIGALTRLTHAVEAIPERLAKERAERADLDTQVARARDRVGEPFAHLGELADSRREFNALATELQRRYREDVPTDAGTSDGDVIDTTVDAKAAHADINELRHQLSTVSSEGR
ncbi:MAG TPA: helicase-related protein, partial [Gaiellaceae bacterium]|nr:helicase-related protein [Gaiellaceae bacterium]